MKKNSSNLLLPFALLAILFISSCELKEKTEDTLETANLLESVKEDAIVSAVLDDINSQVEQSAKEKENEMDGSKKSVHDDICATISIDDLNPENWPKTLTIDFGTDGCEGAYGVTRKGIITVAMTDRYKNAGCQYTVSFTDFFVNNYQVIGTKTIVNNGRNNNGNLSYTTTVEDMLIITPQQDSITRSAELTREWSAGEDTPFIIIDDEYDITGQASGVTTGDFHYTTTIVKPLHVKLSCPWITSGKITIEGERGNTVSLDYGDGECDATGTATIFDRDYTIPLR